MYNNDILDLITQERNNISSYLLNEIENNCENNNEDKIRVLLYGDVNLNLIDGSAIWVLSVANMLSTNKNIEIDVVLKARIIEDRLVNNLRKIENVNIINPFDNNYYKNSKNDSLTSEEVANFINIYSKNRNYDFFLFRGLRFVKSIVKIEEIIKKSWIYLTDFPHSKDQLTPGDYDILQNILSRCQRFLAQTKEMREYICSIFAISPEKISILNPMVPNIDKSDLAYKNKNNSLVYTGKFAEMWNCIEFVKASEDLLNEIDINLQIAGDKFNKGIINKNFEEELTYLLKNSQCVNWRGGMSREDSLELIKNCDIGISWRSEELNDSLELSTKFLEYGINGKAVILNKTKMHIELLGDDYPLYANSEDEFKEKVKLAFKDSNVYEKASKKVVEVCERFTFYNTYKRLESEILKSHQYNRSLKTKYEFDLQDYEYLKSEYKRLLKKCNLQHLYNIMQIDKQDEDIDNKILILSKRIIDVYNIIPNLYKKGE